MQPLDKSELIQIGQHVTNSRSSGAVVAIHGEQKRSNVQTLGGGFIRTGGSAEFDIIWSDGSQARRLPECILCGGLPWVVYDLVHGVEELEELRDAVTEREEQERLEAEECSRLSAEERERCLKEYSFLERVADTKKTPWALCASNIRTELRRAFPAAPFSVRSNSFAGGDSVHVAWTDGPTTAQVQEVTDKYEEGSFDGMEDMYVNRRGPGAVFSGLFGGTKYLSVDRHYSDETLGRVILEIHAEHDSPENPIPEVKEFKNGRLRDAIPARHCDSYQELVSDRLKALDLTPKAPAPGAASVGQITGAIVRHNATLAGVEIMFPTRPDPSTLDALRESNFRWSSRSKLWYAKFTPRNWELAHKLVPARAGSSEPSQLGPSDVSASQAR